MKLNKYIAIENQKQQQRIRLHFFRSNLLKSYILTKNC